jgi:hypothetical protein
VKVHHSIHRDEIIVDVGVQYSGDLCIQVGLVFSFTFFAFSVSLSVHYCLAFCIVLSNFPEAVFLVVRDPSMNEF